MKSPRLVSCALLAGLLALAGCSKKGSNGKGPEELLYGKWEATGEGINWSVLGPQIPKSGKVLRFRKGKVDFLAGGAEISLDCAFADGALTVQPVKSLPIGQTVTGGPPQPLVVPKALWLEVKVNGNELTLTDNQGKAQSYQRAAAVAGEVKISALPICCADCGVVLRKELAEVPGVSDISIDEKSRSATLKINDLDRAEELYAALKQAGMHGQVAAGGKPVPRRTFEGGMLGVLGVPPTELHLRGVHACCPACQEEITRLLDGAKVTFSGDGPVKTLKIVGDRNEYSRMLGKLTQAGYAYQHVK